MDEYREIEEKAFQFLIGTLETQFLEGFAEWDEEVSIPHRYARNGKTRKII